MLGSKRGRSGGVAARNHTVSVHVTSSISGRTFHRTFSWWVVRVLIGVGGGLVLLVVVGIGGLLGWIGSTSRVTRLQAENDSLRVQFRRLEELEANLARMSQLNEQMQAMLGVGLPAEGAGGDSLAGGGRVRGGGPWGNQGSSPESPKGDGGARPGRAGSGASTRETGAD